MATCTNCHSADARPTKDLCPACYMHRRRTGHDRTEDMVIRLNTRRFEAEVVRSRTRAC